MRIIRHPLDEAARREGVANSGAVLCDLPPAAKDVACAGDVGADGKQPRRLSHRNSGGSRKKMGPDNMNRRTVKRRGIRISRGSGHGENAPFFSGCGGNRLRSRIFSKKYPFFRKMQARFRNLDKQDKFMNKRNIFPSRFLWYNYRNPEKFPMRRNLEKREHNKIGRHYEILFFLSADTGLSDRIGS